MYSLANQFPFYTTTRGEDAAATDSDGRLVLNRMPISEAPDEWQHHTLAFFAAGRAAVFPRPARQSCQATSMGAATAIEE